MDAKLAELGIDGTLRSEALDMEQHLRLSAAFGVRVEDEPRELSDSTCPAALAVLARRCDVTG